MHLSCIKRRIFSIKSISLVLLSLQTTTMVLLLRYSRTLNTTPLLHHSGTSRDSDMVIKQAEWDELADKPGKASSKLYVISTAVCLAEMIKLILSLMLLHIQSGFAIKHTKSELLHEVFGNLTESVKMVVPAGLYLVQNNLLFLALTNLDAATYQVTYQLRILCTAGFSWLLLGRRLGVIHWLALACLMVGVALVQVDAGSETVTPPIPGEAESAIDVSSNQIKPSLPKSLLGHSGDGFMVPKEGIDVINPESLERNALPKLNPPLLGAAAAEALDLHRVSRDVDVSLKQVLVHPSHNKEVSWLLGLLSVLVSCILSGFSGVYFERLVKRSRQTSLIIRNIQLGIFSLLFGILSVCSDRRLLWDGGFFQGYNWATWGVIALQSCGGLMVSVTMKYADNILKVFATSVSIVLSTLLSSVVLGHAVPSLAFLFGTAIVLAASLLYGLAPQPPGSTAASTKPLPVMVLGKSLQRLVGWGRESVTEAKVQKSTVHIV